VYELVTRGLRYDLDWNAAPTASLCLLWSDQKYSWATTPLADEPAVEARLIAKPSIGEASSGL
jgi:hypothetical protein